MDTKPLRIGYAGSLAGFDPEKGQKTSVPFLNWFWTYSAENVDQSTRSAYYLFKAIELGVKKNKFSTSDIVIDFWGLIDPLNQRQAEEMGLKEIVNISGYTSKAESKQRLAQCDVLFLPMESGKDGNPTLFIPGKVFEYMNAGKPVLCLTNGGDCADILKSSGLGVLADPFNAEEISDRIAELINDHRNHKNTKTPNKEYIEQFEFSRLTKRLAHEFDNLLK
jgi:glycosyltransferase involved in cell wall biosynthesis